MSRNEHTGKLQQTGPASKEYIENITKIFGDKPVARGRFKEDKETGKFIPIAEWNAKYAEGPKPKGPLFIVKNFDAFQSPTSGKVIRNHKELAYDMATTGCRTYEGLEQEQKEVDRYLQSEDKKLEKVIDETVDETMHQIKHNYSRPATAGKVNMTLGVDDE